MKEYLFTFKNNNEIFKKMSQHESEIWSIDLEKRTGQYDCIMVKHNDGSEVKVNSCFLRWAKKENGSEVLLLFPEHLSEMFFFLDDLELIQVINDNSKVTMYENLE